MDPQDERRPVAHDQFEAGQVRWEDRGRAESAITSEKGGGGEHREKDFDSSSEDGAGDGDEDDDDDDARDESALYASQTGDQRECHRASGRPRTGSRRRRIHFEISELQKLYHLPLKTAAEHLGVCEAALKRICRRNHIQKWPYRKLQSIHRRMTHLEDEENTSQSVANVVGELDVRSAATPSKARGELQRSPIRYAKIGGKLSKDRKLDLLEEERQRVIDLAHRASKITQSSPDPGQQRQLGFEMRSFMLGAPLTFGELLKSSTQPCMPLVAGSAYDVDTDTLSCAIQDESALLLLATVCCNEATTRELHTRSLHALRG